MARSKEELLEELRQHKAGRGLKEVKDLLRMFGWAERKAGKENSVWSKGHLTLTLPTPKDKDLKPYVVRLVVREIEKGEMSASADE